MAKAKTKAKIKGKPPALGKPVSAYAVKLGFYLVVGFIFLGVFVVRSITTPQQAQALVVVPPPPVGAPMAPPIGLETLNPGPRNRNSFLPSVGGEVGPAISGSLSRALDQLPNRAEPGVSGLAKMASDNMERSPSGVYYPKGTSIPGLSNEAPGAMTGGGDSGLPPGIKRPTGGSGGGGGGDDNGDGGDKGKKSNMLKKLALWGIGTVCIPTAISILVQSDLYLNKSPNINSQISRRDANINADNAKLAEYLDTLLKLNARVNSQVDTERNLAILIQIGKNSHRDGLFGDPNQPFTSADAARFVLQNYPEAWDNLARKSQVGTGSVATGPSSWTAPQGPTNPVPLSKDLVIAK